MVNWGHGIDMSVKIIFPVSPSISATSSWSCLNISSPHHSTNSQSQFPNISNRIQFGLVKRRTTTAKPTTTTHPQSFHPSPLPILFASPLKSTPPFLFCSVVLGPDQKQHHHGTNTLWILIKSFPPLANPHPPHHYGLPITIPSFPISLGLLK